MGIIEQPLLWSAFLGFLLLMLGLDLFVFQRKAHVLGVREALAFTLLWVSLALVFCGGVYRFMGSKAALEFLGAYLIEFALSVDNLFVFLTLFTFFGVPHAFRHRALFWGILGAIVMRITFILVGIHLVRRFDWLLYVFGVLLIYTGIRLVFQKNERVDVKKNPVFRALERFFPITKGYDSGNFFVKVGQKWMVTPLFVVLVMIETTDIMFALDSIPAVFGVTLDPFIAFSSNAFAILGLRAMYFALAGLMELLRFLNYGLALILVFIGVKMIAGHFYEIPILWTLGVIGGILAATTIASVLYPHRPHERA